MPPEVNLCPKEFDGHNADIFSLGVVLYILVQGMNPFTDASEKCQYYKCIVWKEFNKYWNATDN